MDQTRNGPAVFEKILRFGGPAKDKRDPIDDPCAETGRTALALLQQITQAMKARETRAQTVAQRALDELEASNSRIRALEARALQAETRAKEAEKWLLRLHESIQDTLSDWSRHESSGSNQASSAA